MTASAESPSFESFVEVQLQDNEIAAVDADLLQRLSVAYARSAMLLGWAQDGAQVEPDQWPFLRDQLDTNIAQLEAILRG
jgi:hypothetical protein